MGAKWSCQRSISTLWTPSVSKLLKCTSIKMPTGTANPSPFSDPSLSWAIPLSCCCTQTSSLVRSNHTHKHARAHTHTHYLAPNSISLCLKKSTKSLLSIRMTGGLQHSHFSALLLWNGKHTVLYTTWVTHPTYRATKFVPECFLDSFTLVLIDCCI